MTEQELREFAHQQGADADRVGRDLERLFGDPAMGEVLNSFEQRLVDCIVDLDPLNSKLMLPEAEREAKEREMCRTLRVARLLRDDAAILMHRTAQRRKEASEQQRLANPQGGSTTTES